MSTLNAGKTIDHSIKDHFSMTMSIFSYQHGKPYMLPEKKLPASINVRRQNTLLINVGMNQARAVEEKTPTTVEHHTINLNYAIKQINEAEDTINRRPGN